MSYTVIGTRCHFGFGRRPRGPCRLVWRGVHMGAIPPRDEIQSLFAPHCTQILISLQIGPDFCNGQSVLPGFDLVAPPLVLLHCCSPHVPLVLRRLSLAFPGDFSPTTTRRVQTKSYRLQRGGHRKVIRTTALQIWPLGSMLPITHADRYD